MSLVFGVIHLDRVTVPVDLEIMFNLIITEDITITELIFIQKPRT